MSYYTMTVIVDGAVEQEEDFTNETLLRERIEELATEARNANDGLDIDLYMIHHDHSLAMACECVQYLTDHHPIYSFPADLVYFIEENTP